MGNTLYPANFGGLYINSAGELVILVVEDGRDSEAGHMSVRGFAAEGVITREVVFSYNSLRNAFSLLDIVIPNSRECATASNVDGITLDVINNKVLVSLAEYTKYAIELFRNVIHDAPYIVFHQSPGRA